MKRLLALCLIAATASSLFAQEGMDGPPASSESRKYNRFRHQGVEPTWGLAKIKAVVKGLKEDEDMNRRVSDRIFNSWSLEEKFTYTMIHGEDFSQNCDVMPEIQDEHKKVFAYFPGAFYDHAAWSERQRNFMQKNRTKVVDLINKTIVAKKRVGNNLKNAILELNAVETIPAMAAVYNRDKKDHDILTLMMLLMRESKYQPFLRSSAYKKLYGSEENWRSFAMATPALQKDVLGWGNALYRSKKR